MEELFSFLREMAANNNRPWFHANKERYEAVRTPWMAELDRLITLMKEWEPELAGQSAKTSAFRIYRDTRFSQDKSPLKTYFSAAISPYGRKTTRACYYLHMGLDGASGLYGGIWCPDAAQTRKLRHAIVDNIEEFEEIINAPEFVKTFPEWYGDRLKTIPKGWDRHHPQAELLRLKEYGRFCHCPESYFAEGDWVEKTAERFRLLQPLINFLNYSLDEE